MFTGRQFKLFRLAGIQVYLHWSWFLVALYEIQARSGAYTQPGWNVLEYLGLFAIVTTHEFGHALACRSVGGTPDRIMLWPFGGVAFVDPPQRPGATLWSIAAGPLVNVALAPLLWLLAHVATPLAGPNLTMFLVNIQWINVGLLVFNVLPIYPLDGGQMLRSLLWYGLGRARSLMAATVVGLVGVAAVGGFAVWTRDLWLILISGYIAMNCWSGLQQARVLRRLAKMPRRAGLACPSCHAAPLQGAYWKCGACGHACDLYTGSGECPACHQALPLPACLDCGRPNPIAAWVPAAASH